MRGEGVPQRVWVDGLSNAGFTRSAPACKVNCLRGNRSVGLAAGKQPLSGAFPPPIRPQQFQKPGGQQGLAVFAAFAAAYPDDVAGAIDVAGFESGNIGDPGPGGIHCGQQRAMAEVTRPARTELMRPAPWLWNKRC